MENIQLIEGESVITKSDGDVITLTNYRVRYIDSVWGKAHIVSIMLEKISSIEVRYRSYAILLVLGVIAGLYGLVSGANNDGDMMMGGLFIGLILVIAYFFTRKHGVVISSDGGAKINFHTKGMKRESLLNFINQVELAKRKKS